MTSAGLQNSAIADRPDVVATFPALPQWIRGRSAAEDDESATADGHRHQCKGRPTVSADDRPSTGDAEGRAKQDVAQEVLIQIQAGHCHIRREHVRRPGTTVSEVAL